MNTRFTCALGILILASTALLAGESPDAAQGPPDPVPLYTNEDLQRFGPPSQPSFAPPVPERQEQWDFVTEYLERQYDRLDADRRHELERARMERETMPPPAPVRTRGYLLLPPFAGHGFPPHSHLAPKPGGKPSLHAGRPSQREFLNRRATLHSRPPLTHRTGHDGD